MTARRVLWLLRCLGVLAGAGAAFALVALGQASASAEKERR